MKKFLLCSLVLFSQVAMARQYFQCSSTDIGATDVMVINLQTKDGGTLFLSSGMQNPEDERVLVNINLDKKDKGLFVYKIVSDFAQGELNIPEQTIGKSTDYVLVDLKINNFDMSYSCFARIYND